MSVRRDISRMSCFLTVVAVLCLGSSAWAQGTYNIHFRSAVANASAGEIFTVEIALANDPQAVTAFSFGVKHDATKLTLESVEIAADLQAILGAGVVPDARFYNLNTAPAGGTGFTVGMILGTDTSDKSIAVGPDHALFVAKYRVAAGVTGTTKIDVTGDLGAPKVPVILDLKGVSQAPAGIAGTTSVTVTVREGPAAFIRGNVDQARGVNVTDAVIILNYLFGGANMEAGRATRENCLIAFNVDGSTSSGVADTEDASDNDLADPVYLLNFLFRGVSAPAPLAPFPACGQPATAVDPAFACQAYTCP
jgi:hypothetical protein